tara:strand:- start:85 stop:441 length:357 start_codon:yes stop_codon:yes gene_type:complete
MKIFLTLFVLFFSSALIAQEISGTAWIFYEKDGDKRVILFEDDGTFVFQNLKSNSGNEGKVFKDKTDTWKQNGDLVVISFSDGYKLLSLKINKNGNKMTGSGVNIQGVIDEVEAYIIE